MDDDVAQLAREQRLAEAAELARSRGDARTASTLFERACDFRRAAEAALEADDLGRALPLALQAKADELAERACARLVGDAGEAERVAFHLERRGDYAWAGRLLEGAGQGVSAARAYERAGRAVDAARLLEAAGDVVGASRALEAQARRDPERSDVLVALGGLLLRHGKADAAVRALQRVRPGSPERRAALSALALAFDQLGLAEARAEAESELAGLGGAVEVEAPEAAQAPVQPRLFGRYELVREVASSPHARVLECVDVVRAEGVAVKVFAGYDARGAGRDALARFEREVEVLASLDHPNIVPMRDYAPEGPALVLAWMAGGSLEEMLTKEPLAPARAVEIADAVLSALGEAHRVGILHRDVKPANVLFDEAGVARLADFGVAHLSDLSATATAGVIGTLGYMSPEQREGRPATVRSDLFGVGAVLLEMLTGERPDASLGGAGRLPSSAHRELDERHDAVVLALLDPDPTRRPEDAFAARRALSSLTWPSAIERLAPAPERPKRSSARPHGARLAEGDHGAEVDQWLGRRVVTVPLDPPTLARASAFARAGHRSLQAVLRVDRGARRIWLAEPRGAPLSRPLGPEQASALGAALARLHEVGEVHGAIDPAHVFVDDAGEVTLAFAPPPGPTASVDLDRVALARLLPQGGA